MINLHGSMGPGRDRTRDPWICSQTRTKLHVQSNPYIMHLIIILGSVGQLVGSPTAGPGIVSLIPAWSHTFLEIDHEIISTVILLLLIQEGLLSVTSESMCTKYWLTT